MSGVGASPQNGARAARRKARPRLMRMDSQGELKIACPACTFMNHPAVNFCEMCESSLASVKAAVVDAAQAAARSPSAKKKKKKSKRRGAASRAGGVAPCLVNVAEGSEFDEFAANLDGKKHTRRPPPPPARKVIDCARASCVVDAFLCFIRAGFNLGSFQFFSGFCLLCG